MSFLHHSYPLGHLTALHSHPQAQYCYLHQGGGVITGHDGGGLLVAGQLCLIPAGWAHEFRVLRHSRLSLLYSPQPACTTFSQLQVSPMLAGLFARLPELGEGETRGAYLGVLRHELGLAPPLAGQLPLAADLDPRLLRVLEKLCQAPSVKVTLEALARDCGASVRTLNRLFARQLGCSFRQWRQRVLMGRARQLQHQGMAPAEIAGILGYEDPDAFSAALARVQGRGSAP
ncbi:helix-turn-helix domain-containing protein [Aeromonas mytilicola]